MQVTITLGKKAMEYVTGIPQEELPEILSDVLERSLEQQVKEIPSSEANSKPALDNEILNKILEALTVAKINPESLDLVSKVSEATALNRVVVSEAKEGLGSDTELNDFLDLFK